MFFILSLLILFPLALSASVSHLKRHIISFMSSLHFAIGVAILLFHQFSFTFYSPWHAAFHLRAYFSEVTKDLFFLFQLVLRTIILALTLGISCSCFHCVNYAILRFVFTCAAVFYGDGQWCLSSVSIRLVFTNFLLKQNTSVCSRQAMQIERYTRTHTHTHSHIKPTYT